VDEAFDELACLLHDREVGGEIRVEHRFETETAERGVKFASEVGPGRQTEGLADGTRTAGAICTTQYLVASCSAAQTAGVRRSRRWRRVGTVVGALAARHPPTADSSIDFTKCIKCGPPALQVCQEVQNVWALSFLDRGIKHRMAPAGDITLAESPCVKCGQCPTTVRAHRREPRKRPPVGPRCTDGTKYCVVQSPRRARVHRRGFRSAPGTDLTGKTLTTAFRRLGFNPVWTRISPRPAPIMEEASEFNRTLRPKRAAPHDHLRAARRCFMEKVHYDFIDNFSTPKSTTADAGRAREDLFAKKLGSIRPRSTLLPHECHGPRK